MEEKKAKRQRCAMRIYSEEFKKKVCEEYLAGGVSKVFLLKKYGIRYRSAVQKWMSVYGYQDIHEKSRYLTLQTTSALSHKNFIKDESALSSEKRIKELERLLQDEQLRSEAYNRMINIAEQELKISIRKKYNTK